MPLPDLLKGLAVLLMIQVHITELFVTPLVYDSLAGKISLFLGGVPAAPLFMAVMGYFVVKGGKSSLQLLRRGGQLLIYGLLLNTGLNLHLLIKILNGTYTLNPLEYIFGVDILFLAGYSLIALALLMKMKKYRGLTLAGLAVLIAALTPWVSQLASGSGLSPYLAAFIGSYAPWSYFPLFPWLAYPLTGAAFYYLGKHFWVQKYQKYFFIAALLVFVLLFGKGFSVSTTLAAYYHHSLVFYFWAVAFLMVLFFALRLFAPYFQSTIAGRYLRFLGKNVTAVYVIQWLIIGNVATAIYRSMPLWAGVVSFVSVLVITSLLVYFLNRYKHHQAEKERYRVF